MVITDMHTTKDTTVMLTGLELKNDVCGAYLDATYQIETPEEIKECHIPRICLPISIDGFKLKSEFDYVLRPKHTVDIGFGDMNLKPDKAGNTYYLKVLETKTKEMTLDEIEKKLGHKVKIVNK